MEKNKNNFLLMLERMSNKYTFNEVKIIKESKQLITEDGKLSRIKKAIRNSTNSLKKGINQISADFKFPEKVPNLERNIGLLEQGLESLEGVVDQLIGGKHVDDFRGEAILERLRITQNNLIEGIVGGDVFKNIDGVDDNTIKQLEEYLNGVSDSFQYSDVYRNLSEELQKSLDFSRLKYIEQKTHIALIDIMNKIIRENKDATLSDVIRVFFDKNNISHSNYETFAEELVNLDKLFNQTR
jgi:hypothetical protein